jgi:hypothetical protein
MFFERQQTVHCFFFLHIGFKQLQKLRDQQCSDYLNQKICVTIEKRKKIICKKRTKKEKKNVINCSSICTMQTHTHTQTYIFLNS